MTNVSKMDPSLLKAAYITDSTHLKRGLVLPAYTSGAASDGDLKPNMIDENGNLVAGMLDENGNLKAGLLKVPQAAGPSTVAHFIGTDPDWVTMGNNYAFNSSQDFQVEFNVRKAAFAGTETIVGKQLNSGTYRGWRIDVNASGQLVFSLYNSLTFRAAVTSVEAMSVDTWYKINATYDGSQLAAGLRLWIDDVEVTYTVNFDVLGNNTTVSTAPLAFGTRNLVDLFFSGDLHTVSITSTAFPADSTWLLQGDFLDSVGSIDGTNSGTTQVAY